MLYGTNVPPPNVTVVGRSGSLNDPARFTCWKFASNTSILPLPLVFDANFQHVNLAGSFKDPNLPTTVTFGGGTFVPYNIQNIGGQLYVEYANFKTNAG